MNATRVFVLLCIFAGLYYGYPKYQDKKIHESIRAGLKQPIKQADFVGQMPPEMKQHIDANMTNNYPNIELNVRFRKLSKSAFDSKMIAQMKSGGFDGMCDSVYKQASKYNNSEHIRFLAKILKEDNVKMTYTVKDVMNKVIVQDSAYIKDCYDFAKLEQGNIPYRLKL